MLEASLILLGAFLGSLPFGVWVTRAVTGKDIQQEGSGNIGATNVARVAGKTWGVAVLFLDAAKGAMGVWLATRCLPDSPGMHVAVGVTAFMSHVFPVWLRFKGGKGVATALGVLLVLLPWAALAGFVVYAVVLAAFRVSSVGSLLGGLTAVIVAFVTGAPRPYVLLALTLFWAMLWTHRGNLSRLLHRSERKL
ncbi:MAG: glycerol-3-phosphate 1-O-acyltransferase PlsY [Myxococcaceae bacterium]|nr:glycerol-3-phosphate 1-O-acyltransferase PlsY [Myxococcaceae bacterium]